MSESLDIVVYDRHSGETSAVIMDVPGKLEDACKAVAKQMNIDRIGPDPYGSGTCFLAHRGLTDTDIERLKTGEDDDLLGSYQIYEADFPIVPFVG